MSYTRTPTATLTELYCTATATAQFEVDPRNPGPGWALRMLGCLWSFQQSRSWGPTVTPLCGLNTCPKWFGTPPCSHPLGGRRECLGSGHLRDRVVSDPGGPNCSPRPLGFSRRPPRYVSGGDHEEVPQSDLQGRGVCLGGALLDDQGCQVARHQAVSPEKGPAPTGPPPPV